MTGRRAFTLIELLVVIAVVALLVSIVLPALGSARVRAKGVACAGRLHQLGIGLTLYLNDFDRQLPQLRVDMGGGQTANIGALFGGKKGTLPAYGINTYGAERRPLNRYLLMGEVPKDADANPFEIEAYRSPADRGGRLPYLGPVESMYDLLGSSYTLNDHALDGEQAWTLIPPAGGRMPPIVTPSKTWVLGTHPIYNYQQNGDRGHYWFGRAGVEANLLFLDSHVGSMLRVPAGIVNTTDNYTFLPSPEWRTSG
ncbi:MAG: prepilin-type N-terminal cleavage/methylation domain-containing protein [Phycisphaerae bacterium]|nr:prepilin-type N-terminal cleavage/methylation domain-containing protein [Phycisphaerae bacterium]